jgi:electron transfer flavoprotein beta subunit
VAGAVKKLDYDLIICGRQAIDGDTAQVGPQIAEHLGIPQVSYVEEIQEVTEEKIVVKRQFEDRYQLIEMQYPCLITTLSELNDPRYMSVGGCFDAYEKEVRIMGYADIADVVDESNIGLKGSPTSVIKSGTKEAKGAGEIIRDVSADEAVKAIVEKLAARHII